MKTKKGKSDDILIVEKGKDLQSATMDHDQKISQFLDGCREKPIKLNLEKF